MENLKSWFIENLTVIIGFVISTLGSGYVVLKRFWSIERNLVELEKDLQEHKDNDKTVLDEIKDELKEIKQDIKLLLMSKK